jgi:hypothetical protein
LSERLATPHHKERARGVAIPASAMPVTLTAGDEAYLALAFDGWSTRLENVHVLDGSPSGIMGRSEAGGPLRSVVKRVHSSAWSRAVETVGTHLSREPSPRPLIVVGFAIGAAVGILGHLAGLDSWASVPICAGTGGGVGSGFAWLRSSSRRGSK